MPKALGKLFLQLITFIVTDLLLISRVNISGFMSQLLPLARAY